MRHFAVMWKPSGAMKSRGIFFSTLATSVSFATPIFQRYGLLEMRTMVGITPDIPLAAISTAALPTAYDCSRSVFEAICRAARCR